MDILDLDYEYKQTLESDGCLLEVLCDEWCDMDALIPAIRAVVVALSSNDKEDMQEAGVGLAEVLDKGIVRYAEYYAPHFLTEGMEGKL